VKIRRTKTFDKTFLKLPAHIQLKTEKSVKLLLTEFYHIAKCKVFGSM